MEHGGTEASGRASHSFADCDDAAGADGGKVPLSPTHMQGNDGGVVGSSGPWMFPEGM